MAIIYTKHALEMLKLRNIRQELADKCADDPDNTLGAKEGKKIHLKDCGKNFLKLIIADEPPDKIVVTAHWLEKKRLKRVKST